METKSPSSGVPSVTSSEGHLSFFRTWWMVGVGGTRSGDEHEPEPFPGPGLFFLKLLAVMGTRTTLILSEGTASSDGVAFHQTPPL